jgi:hypothetical protein
MHEEIEITNTNNINMFWYYPPYQIMEVLKNISSVETSLMFSNQKHLIISDLNGYDVIISPKSDESIKN